MRLHLDFETRSECDLKRSGLYKYMAHPSTRALMLGWALDDNTIELWTPQSGALPSELKEALEDPEVTKHAYNAPFERLGTRHLLGVEVPIEQWRCTMVESYYLGFAGSLNQVLEAVGLEKKDARGGRLINLFSSPAPKNHKVEWYDHTNRPEEWEEFCGYCKQDVRVERLLWHWLQKFPKMLDWDYRQYALDQKINERGCPVDVALAESALDLWYRETKLLRDDLVLVTGLNKPTRGPFLEWLTQQGVNANGTTKDELEALRKTELPPEVIEALDLWGQKEAKAPTKYAAIVHAAGEGDRARGMFQYKGASRTDRVGGRLIQLQNLKRPVAKSLDEIPPIIDAIMTGDPLNLRGRYPGVSVSEMLGGAVRHAVSAKPGHRLVVADLSSIESVVLGWLTNCKLVNSTFQEGKDSYKVFASAFFGVEYDNVDKGMRTFSKPPVLGCGYMLGWRGLIAYAEGYGVDLNESDSKRAVTTFRSMYPEIPEFWRWINEALASVTNTWVAVSGYRLEISRDDEFLRIKLPSGRFLSYHKPEIQEVVAPWNEITLTSKAGTATLQEFYDLGWTDEALVKAGYIEPLKMVDNFTYMGTHMRTTKWCRISSHAGGTTENIVQSIASDILWRAISLVEKYKLPVVLHVHDEIGVEVPDWLSTMALKQLIDCLTTKPVWAKDLWLGAEGYITKRFTKV